MHCEFPDDAGFVLAKDVILDAAGKARSYFSDLSSLETGHKLNGATSWLRIASAVGTTTVGYMVGALAATQMIETDGRKLEEISS